ncbi:MAG: apolipoprotein N-acyltransferase [Treponema sp.]|jgi:apolipoprotein N-acyltransferase|nr:apolipoprotein N-acyltransferase [Treponema sp.]
MKTLPVHKNAAGGAAKSIVQSFFFNLGLTALSVLLFAGAFPNLLFEHGLPALAWIAYVPIFILLYRVSLAASVFWGAVYGYAAYGLFNYWLAAFHPLAGIIVYSIYMTYNAALFFALRLAVTFFPRRAYLVQWLIWLAYEYLCTKGFLGYPYGITGYSQWRMIPLIQIANLCGVWGVSALVVFSSVWLGAALGGNALAVKNKTANPIQKNITTEDTEEHGGIISLIILKLRVFFLLKMRIASFFRTEKVTALCWAAALVAALCYGFAQPADYSSAPTAHIALIQHNTDPWKGGIAEYRSNYVILKRLSDEALAAQPKPDMVVWSETAFVPRIYWHETYRDDPPSWLLVKELREYLAAQEVPFVIGNDDARKDPAKNPRAGEDFRIDYNAVMLFDKGKNTAVYRKLHLVPFTEHFPYEKQLPPVHRALVNADTHFWEKGTEATVFSGPGFTFSTPICFEDTFGYLSRKFVQNGADLIVNLSNDAWSRSLPAQNQHLSMAVFRAVENGRSMVRSTASGQTCGITPDGRVIALAPPFTEAWLTIAIPIVKNDTVYTRRGDYLGIGCTIAAFSLLLLGGLAYIITIRRKS